MRLGQRDPASPSNGAPSQWDLETIVCAGEDGGTVILQPPRRPATPGRAAVLVQVYPLDRGIGVEHALDGNEHTIGRADECNVCVRDPSVSRRHARVWWDQDGYRIEDLSSTNGIHVNGVRCASSALGDGDSIRMGDCLLRFLSGGNAEAAYHRETYRRAVTDGLTRLPNVRYLEQHLEAELDWARQQRAPLGLLLFDADHFKAVNDTLGHPAGDAVLCELADRAQRTVGWRGLVARYGGEEFVAVLSGASRESARMIGERLREAVQRAPFRCGDRLWPLTISVGVSGREGDDSSEGRDLLRKADEKLYEAKRRGRNCVAG